MSDKYHLTREQNIFMAQRNIVDYIWKSANLEGIEITYSETQAIYDGGIVNGLTVNEVLAINNLKYVWQFILKTEEIKYDYYTLCSIHKYALDKLVPDSLLGHLRNTPVRMVVQIGNQTFQLKVKYKKN